jgi:hemolysin III
MSGSGSGSDFKPMLRGHFHQAGFFLSLGAGAMLLAETHEQDFIYALIYVIALVALYGFSTLYHRPNWEPAQSIWFRRLDHAAIYVMIAGSSTPIAAKTLGPSSLHSFLVLMWSVAAAGCLQSFVWTRAPKFLRVTFYVVMGHLAFPYLSEMNRNIKGAGMQLLLIGGIAYVIGAIIYAFKKPNFFKGELGYHELFHILVVFASMCHFILIRSLLMQFS